MGDLRISLFGKLEIRLSDQFQTNAWTRRGQELLCYLILYRNKPHPRETLIDVLWSDFPPAQSKKHLRQVLWEMQTALRTRHSNSDLLLLAEPEWIALNPNSSAWFDVAEFEQAYRRAQATPGEALDMERAGGLQRAVELYRGDLLEGWYQDWCLYERERLQNMYLDMLDKLMAHCEAHQQYEAGLEHGAKILRLDRARERTHWQLMRLHYLANDRSGALRQYQRCVAALDQELGVKPSQRTMVLHEQIRADSVADLTLPVDAPIQRQTHSVPLSPPLERLKSLRVTLNDLQHQIDQELQALEDTLSDTH
jgi:DNA-binding SARP family transcriptional activator